MLSSILNFKQFYEWIVENQTERLEELSTSEYYKIGLVDIEIHFTSHFIEIIITLEDKAESRISFNNSGSIVINGTNTYYIEQYLDKILLKNKLSIDLSNNISNKKAVKI